jgi:hypothetical protein
MSGGTLAMAQTLDEVIKIVRERQTDIQIWQRQVPKPGYRKIAAQLGVSASSYLRALAAVMEGDQANAIAVDKRVRTNTHNQALAKVYEGTPIHTSENVPALLQEALTQIPAWREIQEYWPVLKKMAQQWSEQQPMAQIPEDYQKYNSFYSVRLNDRLIDAIKAYAKRHRLTQSELITAGVLQVLSQK